MKNKKRGFTLAEALATLGLIGVIAALTIPVIVTDVREHTYKVQKQAFKTDLNSVFRNITMNMGSLDRATGAEDFVINHFSKGMMLSKICVPNSETSEYNKPITECGFDINKGHYLGLNALAELSIPNSLDNLTPFNKDNAIGAVSSNGTAMLIWYNNTCSKPNAGDEASSIKSSACVNIVYDVNGHDAPNLVGKDVGFATIFYPRTAKVAAPVLFSQAESADIQGLDAAKAHCASFSKKGEIDIPDAFEAASMYINRNLLQGTSTLDTTVMSHKTLSGQDPSGPTICVYR